MAVKDIYKKNIMEFSFKNKNRILGELTVKDGNTVITQDVVGTMGEIYRGLIDNLIYVSVEMVQFQGKSVAEFFFQQAMEHCNNGELEELKQMFNPDAE